MGRTFCTYQYHLKSAGIAGTVTIAVGPYPSVDDGDRGVYIGFSETLLWVGLNHMAFAEGLKSGVLHTDQDQVRTGLGLGLGCTQIRTK